MNLIKLLEWKKKKLFSLEGFFTKMGLREWKASPFQGGEEVSNGLRFFQLVRILVIKVKLSLTTYPIPIDILVPETVNVL